MAKRTRVAVIDTDDEAPAQPHHKYDHKRKAREEDAIIEQGAWFERLQSGIAIDKNALDDCLIEQPQLFYEISERLALTMSRRDAQKDEVKVVEAEVDEVIRADAVQEEKKITEGAIKQQIEKHPDVIAANKELRVLNQQVAHLGALKEAYSQRSYMLREVVALHLAGYYEANAAGVKAAKGAQYDQTRGKLHEERVRRRNGDG